MRKIRLIIKSLFQSVKIKSGKIIRLLTNIYEKIMKGKW